LARSFTGGTDRVVTPSLNLPATISILWWCKNPGSFGIIWDFQISFLRTYHNGSGSIIFDRNFAGGSVGSAATHGLTLANLNHMAWTHDGTSAVPTFYGNGTPVAGGAWSPSGAVTTTSCTFGIGNKTDGTQSSGASHISYVALHNVVLTQAEILEAMRYGFTPRGLIGFWPLFGVDSPEPDYSGRKLNGTVTGTSVVPGPPVAWPLLPPSIFLDQAADAAAVAAAIAQQNVAPLAYELLALTGDER